MDRHEPAEMDQDDFIPPTVPELNAVIGEAYEVTALLAAGGMGAVYLGVQRRLGREVAIKLLPLLTGPLASEMRERFAEEARVMAKLPHDHVVGIFDSGETSDGQPYLVMEYVRGESLHGILLRGSVPLSQTLDWMVQLCRGLVCIHEKNLVHLDLKPSNLMVAASDGRLKIGDFGLAEQRVWNADPDGEEARTLWVTPGYSAPECFRGTATIDRRADIYSAGAIFYELLTGTTPVAGSPPPSQVVDGLDPRLDSVVMDCLSEIPEDRWQNAQFLVWEIERFRPDLFLPVLAEPNDFRAAEADHPRERRSGRVPIVVLSLLLCLSVGSGVAILLSVQRSSAESSRRLDELNYETRSLSQENAGLRNQLENASEKGKILQDVHDRLAAEVEDLRKRPQVVVPAPEPSRVADLEERLRRSEEERSRLAREMEDFQSNQRAEARKKAAGMSLGPIRLATGQTLEDVTILEVTDAFLRVRHRSGLASLPFEDLPEIFRAHFGYSPQLAEAEREGLRQAEVARLQSRSDSMDQARSARNAALLERNLERQAQLRSEMETIQGKIAEVEENKGGIRKSRYDKDRIIGTLRRDLGTRQNELTGLINEAAALRSGR